MIIWLNGPFGVGKSTLAAELHRALKGSLVADPERVGDLLRGAMSGHELTQRDYQDYPPWRQVTATLVTSLAAYTGGPVIVPMTILDPHHATDLLTPLREAGLPVHHLVLHADPDVLQQRITTSDEFPSDPVRSEAVRAYRHRRAADYQKAADSWMHAHGHVIDTSTLAPGQTLSRPPSPTCTPPDPPLHRRTDLRMTTSTLLEAGPAPNPGGGPGRPPGSATTPAPGAVFAPPEDPHNRIRMVRAHTAAAGTLCVRAHGERTWGFKGRTLSRRADDHHWLRVVSSPLDKEPGITRDGTACADTLLPRSVPRPRVHDLLEWTDRTHRYRAELFELLPRPVLQPGGPVLTRDLDLPDTWWVDLRGALTVTATVPTRRQAARIRAAFPDVFGTQEGRVGELVALAQLLQVSERGGHPELTPHLARRAEQLTGVPVPLPPVPAL